MAVAVRSHKLVLVLLVTLSLLAIGQAKAEAALKSDCSGVICEQVTHSGGTVSQWVATVDPGSGFHCRTVRFRVDGGLIDGANVCGQGRLVAYADTPFYLSSGSQLCVQVVNESGYPCVTI